VSGNTITVTLPASSSADVDKARKACDSHSPGGSIHVVEK
jgi:hypothetical protein